MKLQASEHDHLLLFQH